MDSLPKPFPLTRFIHYGNFRHYYAFGNTPAEDFLRSVAADPATPTRPKILSLGCGDIRSCMYTLWKNFGFEGKSISGFEGVDFVLNDCSAAVLARNVLFLYLCLCMPEDGASRAKKEWVASVWSIWYNHELTPEHDEVLSRALAQLLQWSGTAQEWAQCRLGVMVRFSSPATFRAIKQVWELWHGRGMRVKSVEAMKQERQVFQALHFQKGSMGIRVDTDKMMQTRASQFLNPLRSHSHYPQEGIDAMIQECVAYLEGGSAFAEPVLNLPHSTGKTSVNMTLFERANGSYTLQYELFPYSAFHYTVLYSRAEVSGMTAESEAIQPLLPVADKHFKKAPLLANSVQQFTMWLTATANVMKKSKNCKVLFMFDCSDAISFCQTLFQFPEQCSHGINLSEPPMFDAIYTSNLLDPLVGASALILVAATLLKSDGVLFTASFQYKAKHDTTSEYIEGMFSFPPELLPIVLGIRCIGHDGQYSSTVAPEPLPLYANATHSLQPLHVSLLWKHVLSQPIIIPDLTEEAQLVSYLLRSCISNLRRGCTIDTFLVIANHFFANIQTQTSTSHQFWKPLCKEIVKKTFLKPYLIQLQTQSLLHGFHMHITVTEANCPLCTGQPLHDYIGGYTISFTTSPDPYTEPSFIVKLESGFNDFVLITSTAGSSNGSNIQLNFFIPKQCAQIFNHFSVYKDVAGNDLSLLLMCTSHPIVMGKLQDVSSCSPSNYVYMNHKQVPTFLTMQTSMGEIIKHKGDASRFETTLAITKTCALALEKTVLKAERIEVRKLQILCNSELHMTVVYPYPIQSNPHIKLSRKKKTIVITAERAISCSYNEDPVHYVDCNSALTLPRIQKGDQRIKSHFTLQIPLPDIDPAGPFYMKSVLFQLAEMASDEHVAVAFPSKRIPGNPDIYGMIIVHGIHFDPYFQSAVINISFCFTHKLPKPLLPIVASFWQQLSQNEYCVIWVDDEKYKILNEALAYFATTTRKTRGNPGIPPALAKDKGWQCFQQALIHPLFPNTQLLHVQHAIKSLPFTLKASSSPSSNTTSVSSAVEQPSAKTHAKCAYCEKTSGNLKKCGRCGSIQYCGKECQTKHWKEHKTVCKSSSNTIASTHSSCAHCKKGTNLSRCSCQSVAYCSKECQKLDWPSHQNSCNSRRKASGKPTRSSTADQSHRNACEQSPQSQCKSNSIEPTTQDNASVQKSGKCSNCNRAVFQQLKWCSCHKAAYCSIECQRLNWPLHKDMCTFIKK